MEYGSAVRQMLLVGLDTTLKRGSGKLLLATDRYPSTTVVSQRDFGDG